MSEIADEPVVNHVEAKQLAQLRQSSSNLARCYLDLLRRHPAPADRDAVIEECARAINEARTEVIHSGLRKYIEGVAFGHDRSIAAIRALASKPAEPSPLPAEPPAAAGGGLSARLKLWAKIGRTRSSDGVTGFETMLDYHRLDDDLTVTADEIDRLASENARLKSSWQRSLEEVIATEKRIAELEAALSSANALAATAREDERRVVVGYLRDHGHFNNEYDVAAAAIERGDHLPRTGSEGGK